MSTFSSFYKSGGVDSTSWRASKESLPPAWVDKIESVETDIATIQTKSTFF